MKVAIAAGGTGGHIFPALSVAGALKARDASVDVRFFGPDNRGERRMVEPSGLPFVAVPAAAVRGRGPVALIKSAFQITRGIASSWRSLRHFGADVVFSTGGYGSFPQSVAARLARKPLVVFLPDVSPGLAVRAESRLATKMATTAEAALAFLPRSKTAVTGYPVRPAFFHVTRDSARETLGIKPGERVLLVAGASQGARALNEAIWALLPSLPSGTWVLHITGETGIAQAETLAATTPGYEPFAFRDDLPALMKAADLAVMRAGASVLGELTAAGLPAILVPGTFAGAHQRDNAQWLVDCGAAIIVEEAEIATLRETVSALFGDPAKLSAMAAAATAQARPDAADAIAGIIEEVAAR
jgi:UDP-N-acetylglucosamine--N-acetylmuramyl-(pentapeptide) pyrophosphoryl-undecaprenol N-acetylglucosamine transferase